MVLYLEIKQGTKEYGLADKIYTSKTKWGSDEVFDALESAIGTSINGNLECNARVLRLYNIPEGTQDQFKSKLCGGKREAKSTSEINKKYLEVVKKYELISYGMTEFSLESGLFDLIHSLNPVKTSDGIRFFVELKDDVTKERIEKHTQGSFVEIKESEYLILRAKALKEIGR